MSILDRFQLFLIVRNQVSDRDLLRRYLAVEAAMEEMVPLVHELNLEHARLVGLGAGIDVQLCRANPTRLGEVASEILATEGAPAEVSEAVLARRRTQPEALTPLSAGLLVAELIIDEIYELMDVDEDGLDEVRAVAVTRRLERRSRRPGNEDTRRLQEAAVARLGLPLERIVDAALAGMRRIREDLRL